MMLSCLAGMDMSGMELGPTDWPTGCLGYAFNLLRPAQSGHRRQLMFSTFNQVLVGLRYHWHHRKKC